jgi:hypothetical protein
MALSRREECLRAAQRAAMQGYTAALPVEATGALSTWGRHVAHPPHVLPTRRTIELSDGDLVLICTGRFHAVESFDGGDRLSGQCWLSYRRGSPLRLWV